MKTINKLLFTLALTFASVIAPSLTGRAGGGSASAQTIGDAFYIYRNDGGFNAFFREEIDSIAYSNYDLDSLLHDDIVTQVVFTEDSVYRIPLEAIDSVSFVTPETKYQPGIKKIEGELRDYVVSQDSLTIYFSPNMPEAITPHIGDKLVTLEMSETFPIGFAGEVVEVNHVDGKIEVVCTAVALEDIFEYYYGVSEVGWDGTSFVKSIRQDGRRNASDTFSPGKKTLPLLNNAGFTGSYNPNDNLSFDLSELKADISVTPVVYGSAIVTVNPWYGTNVSVTVTGKYDLEENFSMKGGLTWNKDVEILRAPWPIAPLVDVYIALGGFVRAQGEFGISQKWTQQYRSAFHWEYSSRGEEMLKPANKIIPVSSNHSGEAAIKGSIGAGVYVEVGFDFVHTKKLDLANINLRGEAGVKLEGSLVLYKSDMETAKTSTAIYEELRDSELSLNWFYGVTANAKFWKWSASHDVNLGNLKLNNQGKILSWCMAPTFTDVKASRVQDTPSAINAQAKVSCPAKFGGRCIKVDAGFVLKDEEGEDVSRANNLSGYNGSQGTRELSHQFSNTSSDKKYRVYPYVKWMGVNILASPYAEVQGETMCPDDHHPHMIDLGLPSGTKWACCNVGAHAPEEYGGYYAWGETQTKSVYYWDTYQYYNRSLDYPDCYINIGSDIASTSYDAATANWGAPWRMPSLTQIQELISNTTSEWTTVNGVKGRKFTGANGGTIFLPAAGFRNNSGLSDAGSRGDYWSSTLDESNPSRAYCLYFGSDYASWSYGNRLYGRSVRPVR